MKKKRRIWVPILIVILVILMLVALGGMAIAGNFLFEFAVYPEAEMTMRDLLQEAAEAEGTDTSGGAYADEAKSWYEQGEDVSITVTNSGGASQRVGKIFRGDGHRYAILFHGYAGEAWQMMPYAQMYLAQGYTVLAPDALAHGKSGGRYIGMGWLERSDVLSWIDYIVSIDPEAQIVLHGVSMGGATVMMAAGEDLPDCVKCAVEDCGYTSVWDEFEVQFRSVFGMPSFPLLNLASMCCKLRAGYSFGEASSVEQLEKAKIPMLFIHGEEDVFVPYSMLDECYNACASEVKEKLAIPGASHGEAAAKDPELYWDTVFNFTGRFIK